MTNKSVKKQRWTLDERDLAEQMIRAGSSTRAIADVLGRARSSIQSKLWRLRRRQRFRVYTRNQIAKLMNVHNTTVDRWIAHGWLIGNKDGRWYITAEALRKFLDNEEGWSAWSPEQMSSGRWQVLAREIRANQTGRWITVQEAANILHYDASTIRRWIRSGWQVRQRTRQHKCGDTIYIWLPEDGKLPERPHEVSCHHRRPAGAVQDLG